MATEVIHDQAAPADSSSSMMGLLLGIVVLVIIAFFALFYFGGITRMIGSGTAPQVNVPGKVDVNVNHK